MSSGSLSEKDSRAGHDARHDVLWQLLGTIPDPEIPVLSLVDLGIIRDLDASESQTRIGVAPTYSGCPATDVIRDNILQTLQAHGYPNIVIEQRLAPPWSSDWISAAGREKLRRYGIAPPAESTHSKRGLLAPELEIACPRCSSLTTHKVSEFGSTPCKASYKCKSCLEPFEYFKCI
jgi:ring-1,2-phenylacetyl-CoA epoxidase subunit PaaD